MTATGLEVFDKTVQTTNIWLNEITAEIGPDRQLAWHVLGSVLRVLRDRLSTDVAAHFGAQLPLLVRGAFYDQFQPAKQPQILRSRDEFLQRIGDELGSTRPVNAEMAAKAVFHVLDRHLPAGQVEKTREVLPAAIRDLWPEPGSVH